MILIIGGMGFVGSNTAEALLELGEDCIVTKHTNDTVPDFLKEYVGKRVFVEQADITNLDSLLALGKKYRITGIINLVTGGGVHPQPSAGALELVNDVQSTVTSIANTVQAASEWGAKRVLFASAPVIYNGIIEQPWREDQPLPMSATNPMELAKKSGELLSSYLGSRSGVECVEVRLAAMYGPNYDPTRGSLVGRLVHAAVKGEKPSLEGMRMPANAQDGGDQCYIKDAARGIALLQTAEKLNYGVYNVSSGRVTTNQEIVDAVKKVIPEFEIELPPGHAKGAPMTSWHYDIARIHEDTSYRPNFDIEAGVADYVHWLQEGNKR